MQHGYYLLTLLFLYKAISLSEGAGCQAGWTLFGQSCYHIGGLHSKRTWIEAMSTCQQHFGGYLVNIDTEQEQNFIMQFIHSQNTVAGEYWIGGSDRPAEGTWIWEPSQKLISQSYSHWYPRQPNNREGQENCMSVYTTRNNGYDSFWFDEFCDKDLPYVCEKGLPATAPATTTTSTTSRLPTKVTTPTALKTPATTILQATTLLPSNIGITGCLPGWTPHGQSCYHIGGSGNPQDWIASMSTCQIHGGYLVNIDTEQEQNFIMQFIRSQDNVEDEYWLGGSDRPAEGIWLWEPTKNLISQTYSHWRPGQPNNREGQENCMSIYTTTDNDYDTYWFDEYCEKLLSYICEMGILTRTTTTTTTTMAPTTSAPTTTTSPMNTTTTQIVPVIIGR